MKYLALLPFLLLLSPAAAQESRPSSRPAKGKLTWEVPAGWKLLKPRMFRNVNLLVAGKAECYVSKLRGGAGGVAANINRWRRQMGKRRLGAEEIAKLPRTMVLGVKAVVVTIDGTYHSMRGGVKRNQRMVGVIIPKPGTTYFVKMIGSKPLLEKEQQRFEQFLGSLSLGPKKVGGKTAKQWIAVLRTGKEPDRVQAVEALGKIGSAAAISPLTLGLVDESAKVRAGAARALIAFGARAKSAIPELLKRLDDKEGPVRAACADALGAMGEAAVGALTKALKSKQDFVKAGAARAIAVMGKTGAAAAKNTMIALDDGNPIVRRECALALARLGSAARPALTLLRQFLQDDDVSVRVNVAIALAALGEKPAPAVPLLKQALTAQSPRVRAYACEALGALGKKAKEFVPALRKACKDGDASVRAAATKALPKVRGKAIRQF